SSNRAVTDGLPAEPKSNRMAFPNAAGAIRISPARRIPSHVLLYLDLTICSFPNVCAESAEPQYSPDPAPRFQPFRVPEPSQCPCSIPGQLSPNPENSRPPRTKSSFHPDPSRQKSKALPERLNFRLAPGWAVQRTRWGTAA